MSRMLLSINPEHVENILLGKKKYEFRKVRCRRNVSKVFIYETAPKKMVVAEAELHEVIEDETEEVWRQTRAEAGISYAFFQEYFRGRTKAVAYRLVNVQVYKTPKCLSDFGVRCAPQSFVYLDVVN